MNKSYIQIYTGDGKGKTTAAFGLAVRALCAGKSVYVGQFVKSMPYNEARLETLLAIADPSFGRIHIEQLGRGCFIDKAPETTDIELARIGLRHCAKLIKNGTYDIVILDELCIAIYFGLLTTSEVLTVLKERNPHTEIIITGRKASQELIAAADLVTEMREVKHYYNQGVLSRDGIDR